MTAISTVLLAATLAAPPTTDVQVTSKRHMVIPFDPLPFHFAESVVLYVSTDCGKSWELHERMTPSLGRFTYQGEAGKQYWFALQTRDADGADTPDKLEALTPQLKVVVLAESDKPVLQGGNTAATRPDGGDDIKALKRRLKQLRRSAGTPDHPSSPPVGRQTDAPETVISAKQFMLPVSVNVGGRDHIAEVVIYVSSDQGKTWHVHDRISPTCTEVAFEGKNGESYWFAVQTKYKSGRLIPATTAGLITTQKVRVETQARTWSGSAAPFEWFKIDWSLEVK